MVRVLQDYDNPVSIVITLHPEPRIRISCLFLDHSQRSPWRTPVLVILSLLPITQVENDRVRCDLLLRGSLWAEDLQLTYGQAAHLNRSLHETRGACDRRS